MKNVVRQRARLVRVRKIQHDLAASAAAAREDVRRSARRDQESAEKLQQAAVGAAERLAERRPLRSGRYRSRLLEDGEGM